jgi:hypothetical protein
MPKVMLRLALEVAEAGAGGLGAATARLTSEGVRARTAICCQKQLDKAFSARTMAWVRRRRYTPQHCVGYGASGRGSGEVKADALGILTFGSVCASSTSFSPMIAFWESRYAVRA